MGRKSGESLGDGSHIDAVYPLEFCLAHPVLFGMVLAAKADGPLVGGLQCRAPIGATSDVCTFDWKQHTAYHRAVVPPHPCSVRRAGPPLLTARFPILGGKWLSMGSVLG